MTGGTRSRYQDVVDVLTSARDLITPDGAWTKGELARAIGVPTFPNDPTADCWCMSGALLVAAGDSGPLFLSAVLAVEKVIPFAVPKFNDAETTTQEEVIEAFNKAIERLRAA